LGAEGATLPSPAVRSSVTRPSPPPPSPQKKKDSEPVATIVAAHDELRQALVTAVTHARPMLGALLDQASTITVDGGSLVVGFGPGDDGLRRMLSGDENLRALTALAEQTLGRTLSLKVSGAPDDARSSVPRGAEGTDDPPPASREGVDAEGSTRLQLMERARKDPGVQRVLREFGAQIIDVRPLSAPVNEDPVTAVEETP
jgi:hypothetical protein